MKKVKNPILKMVEAMAKNKVQVPLAEDIVLEVRTFIPYDEKKDIVADMIAKSWNGDGCDELKEVRVWMYVILQYYVVNFDIPTAVFQDAEGKDVEVADINKAYDVVVAFNLEERLREHIDSDLESLKKLYEAAKYDIRNTNHCQEDMVAKANRIVLDDKMADMFDAIQRKFSADAHALEIYNTQQEKALSMMPENFEETQKLVKAMQDMLKKAEGSEAFKVIAAHQKERDTSKIALEMSKE